MRVSRLGMVLIWRIQDISLEAWLLSKIGLLAIELYWISGKGLEYIWPGMKDCTYQCSHAFYSEIFTYHPLLNFMFFIYPGGAQIQTASCLMREAIQPQDGNCRVGTYHSVTFWEEGNISSDSLHLPDFPCGISTVTCTDTILFGHLTSGCVQHICGHRLCSEKLSIWKRDS